MIRRVVPNISTRWVKESTRFDLALQEMQVAIDSGRILTRYLTQNGAAQISLLKSDEANAPSSDMTIPVEVDDVDAVHENAFASVYNIVYPLTADKWGVRRFHVQDSNGIAINVMVHHG